MTDNCGDLSKAAHDRSYIYNLFAIIFREEPSGEFLGLFKEPGFFEHLRNLGVSLEEEYFHRPEDELMNELAVEYTRLFLGPGKHISPHESVHREGDESGGLCGKASVNVQKFIHSLGLAYQPGYNGMPDHICVEMEFMGKIAERESLAWQDGDGETALHCLQAEKKFMEEHPGVWVPLFCDKVIAEAELPFYKEMANLTKGFIQFEKEEIDRFL